MGIPTLNFIHTAPDINPTKEGGLSNDFTPLGISLGSDYFYKKNRFFNLTVGLTAGYDGYGYYSVYNEEYQTVYEKDPEPEKIERSLHTRAQSLYVSLTHNHMIKQLALGYGLSYGVNWWKGTTLEDKYILMEEQSKDRYEEKQQYYWKLENGGKFERTENRQVLGFMFHAYWMPANKFYIGMDYRPTFMRFQSHNKFKYEHLISATWGFKFRLSKKK